MPVNPRHLKSREFNHIDKIFFIYPQTYPHFLFSGNTINRDIRH